MLLFFNKIDSTSEIASQAVILIKNKHSRQEVSRGLNMTRSVVRISVTKRLVRFVGKQKREEIGVQLSKMNALL